MKLDSVHESRITKEVLTVFKLFIVEFFRQLKIEAPKFFIVFNINGIGTYTTRWNMEKVMPKNSHAVLKRIFFGNWLHSMYNWLVECKNDTNRFEKTNIPSNSQQTRHKYNLQLCSDNKLLITYSNEKEVC